MSGIEKILARIEADTAREASQLVEAAQKQAARLREESNARSDAADVASEREAAGRVELIETAGESAAHKDGKNLLLAVRREMIATVFEQALDQLRSLKGEALFETLEKIVVQNAQAGDGKLILSEADAVAIPPDFIARCNAQIPNGRISLAEERRETNGGVILQYGLIEINCTFEEMLSASKTQLEDEICRILFRS